MTVTHGGNIFEISRERGWDWRYVADFSASINPLGPAPAVQDAIRSALDRISHYPEREPVRLRQALSRLWKVDEQQILFGNGATELLHFFARVTSYSAVTLAVPAFAEFYRAYPQARCVSADRPMDWPREGLVVLTQPNNPTGALLPTGVLEHTTNSVLIDESFLEFTEQPSATRMLERRPNLYILRSLTKFYALPGLRIGALVAPSDTIDRWRALREPWQVNVLAEEAALAAIADDEHSRRSLALVSVERDWLFAQLAALPGVHPAPSHANYIFVRLDYPAAPLVEHLLQAKILIRDCTGLPGIRGEAVRIAVRTHAENERLIAWWKEFPCIA